ncbi:hypothetical protein STCU_10803 [Strigomonas culicis]|uniref:Uncharacterized protein n=1 Tax=Strigomonas culicis TaxID=28005 RepID=S9V2W2_9TRYP|nr:hypothetical protein STCU_10803 [Strigomonas culicis]|eukprot:EPY17120.1 hypothetical protein STCU_10803 [Strigomonas culicis]
MSDVLTYLFYIVQKVNNTLVPTELSAIVRFLKGQSTVATAGPPTDSHQHPGELDTPPPQQQLRVGLSLWNTYIPLAVVPESFTGLLGSSSSVDGAEEVAASGRDPRRAKVDAAAPPTPLQGAAKVHQYFEGKGFQRVFQLALADSTSRREARLSFIERITDHCDDVLRAAAPLGAATARDAQADFLHALAAPPPPAPTAAAEAKRGSKRRRTEATAAAGSSAADVAQLVDRFVRGGQVPRKAATAATRETHALLFVLLYNPSEGSAGGADLYAQGKGGGRAGPPGGGSRAEECLLFAVLHEIHALYQLYQIKSKYKAVDFHFSVLLLPENMFSHNHYTHLMLHQRLETHLSSFYHIHLFEKKKQQQQQQPLPQGERRDAAATEAMGPWSEEVHRVVAVLRVWDAALLESFCEVRKSTTASDTAALSERSLWKAMLQDPLLFFLRPANVHLGVFLSEALRRFPWLLSVLLRPDGAALAQLKAAYCFRHQLEDVALLLHQLLAPFAFWRALLQPAEGGPRRRQRHHFTALTEDSTLLLNALYEVAHVVQRTIVATPTDGGDGDEVRARAAVAHSGTADDALTRDVDLLESTVLLLLLEDLVHGRTQRLFHFDVFQNCLLSIYEKERALQNHPSHHHDHSNTDEEDKDNASTERWAYGKERTREEKMRWTMEHLLPSARAPPRAPLQHDGYEDRDHHNALDELMRRPTNVKLSVARPIAQFLLQYVDAPQHSLRELSLVLDTHANSEPHLSLQRNFFNTQAIPNNVRLLYLLVMNYYFNARGGGDWAQQRSRGTRSAPNASGSNGNVSFYYLKHILQINDEELVLLLKELDVAGCIQLNLKTESVKLLLTAYA